MATKILVIDDDLNICDLLRMYCENAGYEVKTANDGEEGFSAFKTFEPDLVLLDPMLPKKDGNQVCREIREISSKPIIMLTAKSEVFDKVLGLELGADDFIVKPFETKELSARVKAVLRRCNSHDNKSARALTFPRRSLSFSSSLLQTATAFSPAISFLTRYGDLITSATRERLTFT